MPSVDLTPEALARLEAQLQADLDAVRRVRALLAAPKVSAHPSPVPPPATPAAPVAAEEKIAPAPAAVPPAQTPPIQTPPLTPYVPPPSTDVAVAKAVALMEGEFGPKHLKEVFAREHLGGHSDPDIRRVLKGMVKSGALLVVRSSVGRGGSTYRRATQG